MPLKPVDQGALAEGRSKEREVFQLVNRLRDAAQWHDNRRWAGQLNWYWDPVNGNDNNSGASATDAVLTHEEIYYRTKSVEFGNNNLNITITNDVPDQLVRLDVGRVRQVNYQAQPTVLGTGAVTAVTTLNTATNDPWEIEDTAIATSWTASGYVNKLIVFRSGSTVTASGWVDRDLGSKICRLGPLNKTAIPTLPTPYTLTTTAGVPAVGNTYTVYSLPNWAPTNLRSENFRTAITMYGLNFTGSFGIIGVNTFFAVHCKFGSASYNVTRAFPASCLFTGTVSWQAQLGGLPRDCIFQGFLQVNTSLDWEVTGGLYFTNGGAGRVTHCTNARVDPNSYIGLFDVPASNTALYIDHQTTFGTRAVFGDNNAGTLVRVGGPGCSWYYGSVPTATTSGNELIMGVGAVVHAFADLPITTYAVSENVYAVQG